MSSVKVDVTAVRNHQVLEQHRTALQWLSPLDFPAQQHDIISRKENGTGQWFLGSAEFGEWQQGPNKMLFCPGIPGAGKTMVAAIAIEHLLVRARSEDIGVAFLFCNYKAQAEQTCGMLLATLLRQLLQNRPEAVSIVARMHDTHQRHNTRPSLDELQSALQAVCSTYTTVYIVVDALDEFTSQDRPRTAFIEHLRRLQSSAHVRLLFTSRFIPEIQDEFTSDPRLEVKASDHDVRKYVSAQIPRLPRCIQDNISLVKEVQDSIVEAVDGMYVNQ